MRSVCQIAVILGAALSAQGPAVAEDASELPSSFPQATSRTVKPPLPGAKKRITVQLTQINPSFPDALTDAPFPAAFDPADVRYAPLTPQAPVKGTRYGWYWDLVSPDIAQSRPGRLQEAVAALRAGPSEYGIQGPRLATLQRMATAYGADILKSTAGTRVSPALVMAVMSVESAGNPIAVSHAGAQGLMQLMPATAKRFGVTDSKVPAQNIRGGVAYLDFLMKMFNNDPVLVLAAYNAGEGAVQKSGGVPRYAETRDYVPKVMAAWEIASSLCLTRPQLITDGCVFRR